MQALRSLRTAAIVAAWLAVLALASYELVQKAPRTPLGPLPGSALASRADRSVRWETVTGVRPVDRLLHEGHEACLYYAGLVTGRLATPLPQAGTAPVPTADARRPAAHAAQ